MTNLSVLVAVDRLLAFVGMGGDVGDGQSLGHDGCVDPVEGDAFADALS